MELYIKNAILIALLLLFLVGAFFTLRSEYQKQLQTNENKLIAFLIAVNEYVIKELIGSFLGAILLFGLGTFFVGGLVGLMIMGWKELFSILGLTI